MKRVHYVDDSFLTGDDLADALLGYAEALADDGSSASADVPALLPDGQVGTVKVLVGPASQLFAMPEPYDGDDVVDEAALEKIRRGTRSVDPRQGVIETDDASTGRDDEDYDL